MPGPAATEVADELFLTLSLLFHRIKQTRDDTLSIPEVSALIRLENTSPCTLTVLAKLERISAQSLGATLEPLEARGLIRREADPSDGRQSLLSITDKGRATIRYRRSGRAAHLARALAADFSEEELVALRATAPLLKRLAHAL